MSKFRRFLPLLILVLGLALVFALGLDRYASLAVLRDNRAVLTGFVAGNFVLSALAFYLAYAVMTALSVPGGALLTVTGGFLFGTVYGTALSVLGATTGAALLFLAARTAFSDLLRARAGSAIERMRDGFRANALSYLLFLRLIPAFPFFLVNLVPAFLGVRLSTFVLATLLGIIPGSLVFTLFGSGLGEVFDRGEPLSLGAVLRPEIVAGLVGLAVLSLAPVLYGRFRRNRSRQ